MWPKHPRPQNMFFAIHLSLMCIYIWTMYSQYTYYILCYIVAFVNPKSSRHCCSITRWYDAFLELAICDVFDFRLEGFFSPTVKDLVCLQATALN